MVCQRGLGDALAVAEVAHVAADGRSASTHATVLRARCGDKHAFEHLYRGRVEPVSRYICALVRDPDRAEDLTAQTFLLAWRDLPKLRDAARFDAWLFRIAHNQAMTEVARRRPTARLEDAPDVADECASALPESALESALDLDLLRRALAELPELQRQVLTLRYFQELSCAEVARQLGKNEQSVWALSYRALRRLRRTVQALAAPERGRVPASAIASRP